MCICVNVADREILKSRKRGTNTKEKKSIMR